MLDYIRHRSKPQVPITNVDLSERASQDKVMLLLEVEPVQSVGIAAPFGIASRVCGRPLPKYWIDKGLVAPLPFRSEEQPLGLDGLAGEALIRVTAANKCYNTVIRITMFCMAHFIPFWVEKTWCSYTWSITAFVSLMAQCSTVDYDACVFGSNGNKRQRLVFWGSQLDHVAVPPLRLRGYSFSGGPASQDETAYPKEFC